MRRRFSTALIVLVFLAGALLLPSSTAEAYPCLKCRLLDFGWLGGKEYFCTIGESGDAEECHSGEGWCWQAGECAYWTV